MYVVVIKNKHILIIIFKFIIIICLPFNADERMKHICESEDCTEHDNERDCFYVPLLAYVTYRDRLVRIYTNIHLTCHVIE